MNKRRFPCFRTTLFALSFLALVSSTALADASIRESIKRLNAIYKPSENTDIDNKLLQAVTIIDKMSESNKWQELRKLIDVAEFHYSNYYDELLYIYLVHAANQKNFAELEALWKRMSAMQNSVHLFPAMLARLFSQKDISSPQYRRELSLLLEYVETAPPQTVIHGPMIEGNVLFGYKVREDYSAGDAPQMYHLKDYTESPRPLPGFSDDTQYIGLLEAFGKYNGIKAERAEKLARLYETAGSRENAAGGYFRLAQHAYTNKQNETARAHISKALLNNPNDPAINELKKKIDLALVLASSTPPARFVRTFQGAINDKYTIEMSLKRDGMALTGDYFYKKIGTRIKVEGAIDDQNNFIIREFDEKGNQTGVFKGYFVSESELKGTWSKPNGDKTMQFFLKASQ